MADGLSFTLNIWYLEMYRSWLAADIASRLSTVESKFPDTLRSRHLGIFKSGFVVGEHCQESVSSITDPKVRFTFNLVCNLIELLPVRCSVCCPNAYLTVT